MLFRPRNPPKIAVVGEFPSESEATLGIPFSDGRGKMLVDLFRAVGIVKNDCLLTYVFTTPPPGGRLNGYCAKKAEVGGKDYTHPPLAAGQYVRPEYLHELGRLHKVLEDARPNLVIAFGNAACWALLGSSGISKLRGTVAESSLVPGIKVLPTYSPSLIYADWSLKVVVTADLIKAERESHFPEIRRPKRQVWIDPTLDDLETFYARYLQDANLIAVDVETRGGQITCCGFAPSPEVALVVPFVDSRQSDYSYWPDAAAEAKAWRFVQRIVEGNVPLLYQNGVYDLQYFMRHGLRPRTDEDSMLLHHSLHVEMEKGLGFLGSIYTNEGSWKLLRKRSKDTLLKADDE